MVPVLDSTLSSEKLHKKRNAQFESLNLARGKRFVTISAGHRETVMTWEYPWRQWLSWDHVLVINYGRIIHCVVIKRWWNSLGLILWKWSCIPRITQNRDEVSSEQLKMRFNALRVWRVDVEEVEWILKIPTTWIFSHQKVCTISSTPRHSESGVAWKKPKPLESCRRKLKIRLVTKPNKSSSRGPTRTFQSWTDKLLTLYLITKLCCPKVSKSGEKATTTFQLLHEQTTAP